MKLYDIIVLIKLETELEIMYDKRKDICFFSSARP